MQNLTGINPVRVLDDVGVQPVDFRPQERIVEIMLREVPQRVALRTVWVWAGSGAPHRAGGRCRRDEDQGIDCTRSYATWGLRPGSGTSMETGKANS